MTRAPALALLGRIGRAFTATSSDHRRAETVHKAIVVERKRSFTDSIAFCSIENLIEFWLWLLLRFYRPTGPVRFPLEG